MTPATLHKEAWSWRMTHHTAGRTKNGDGLIWGTNGSRTGSSRDVTGSQNHRKAPINQACQDWADTQAAYRFFKKQDVHPQDILHAHRHRTAERATRHTTLRAIHDTRYFIYTSHVGTKGLGPISLKKGTPVHEIFSTGLIMQACMAVTTEGLPLGLLDQHVCVRERLSAERRRLADVTPIEEKERDRWLEALKTTQAILGGTPVVTVGDREADVYDLFELSDRLPSPVLVRAHVHRAVNKKSRYAEKDVVRLWDFMRERPTPGTLTVEIPERKATAYATARHARTALLTITFGAFALNPTRNNIKHRSTRLPDLPMHAVYAYEINPPEQEEPVEWMVLTNRPVSNFQEALETVRWYCPRGRIERYFNVLKSELNVEDGRLASADRLVRDLTVRSIVAWRLLMITWIARTDPQMPCTAFLSALEWKVLWSSVNTGTSLPDNAPSMGEVVVWIARLGGFLARKSDGRPGAVTLWRGWKRLTDLTEGWGLALSTTSCG